MTMMAAMLIACNGGQYRAHYEAGTDYIEARQTAEAMREFRLVAEGSDVHYAMLAHGRLGHLYMRQNDLAQAEAHFRESYRLAQTLADTAQMVLARRDEARLLRANGNAAEARRLFVQADSLIQASRADSLCTQVYPEWISLLIALGEDADARRLLQRMPVDRRSGPACLVAGRLYLQLEQADSARYYFEQCMATAHTEARASASMFLAEMAGDEEQWMTAYAQAMECAVLVDSAKQQMQTENAHLIESLAGQLTVERQNRRLQLGIAVVVVLATVLVSALLLYVRRRIDQLKHEHEEQLRVRRREARNRQEHLTELFRNTSLYRQIIEHESIDEEQWQQIGTLLDEHADSFTARLLEFYPKMKPQEVQMCQLVKLELTNQQIAAILCRTQQAITNSRKRLFQKMFDREGTADELNRFIRLFPEATPSSAGKNGV